MLTCRCHAARRSCARPGLVELVARLSPDHTADEIAIQIDRCGISSCRKRPYTQFRSWTNCRCPRFWPASRNLRAKARWVRRDDAWLCQRLFNQRARMGRPRHAVWRIRLDRLAAQICIDRSVRHRWVARKSSPPTPESSDCPRDPGNAQTVV